MTKARWTMQCNCGCRTDITVGAQFTRYASRPWKTEHLIAYQKMRRERRAK